MEIELDEQSEMFVFCFFLNITQKVSHLMKTMNKLLRKYD